MYTPLLKVAPESGRDALEEQLVEPPKNWLPSR
jgi:hypothetical protein